MGEEKIEGRFCHSCLVYGDILALYGGMQNSEVTLDNLTVLSIESKQNQKNVNNISKNKNKKFDMLSSNNKKKKIDNNGNKNKNDANISDSNKIYENDNIDNDMEDFAADTNDLININFYSLKELKKNYLNNLMTWNFLKSLSDFYKWPIGCIGNFIKNSLKENINSKNIKKKKKKYKNDEIYFSIKDDGIGMTCSEFNGVMFSFIKNQNKELNYFQYGFSMKAAALRLANNFLIISKTIKEISIGMISIELQKKINDKNCDFILTPIVNYRIEKKDNNKNNGHKYIPKSNFPIESINLILEIIPFLFKSN